MNARELLANATAEGMTVTRDGDQVRVIRPKTEITDAILKEIKARKAEVLLALTPCCGKRPVGVAGGPLVLSCQLCPDSPTYWRDAT